MNSKIARQVYIFGTKYRNKSLWKEYEALKDSEWLDFSSLSCLQLRNAHKFFSFVQQYSPFYKKTFGQCGFSTGKLLSIQDIACIPPVSKHELIANKDAIHTDFHFGKTFLAETSGTTGIALEFVKNERWDSVNRAAMMRSYDWYGVKPWDRSGYFWGYNSAPSRAIKIKFLDALQNQFRVFDYKRRSIEAFARRLYSADYIAGYSSMIYEVAKLINQMGLPAKELKLVKGTSEMILDVYHAESKKAFGRKVTSEYGAAEAGLIAFECPQGNMHINIENVIVEVEEDGGILVTNLASWSFPIIRYRLGDVVRLSSKKCACGRSHPIIEEILGRKGSVVHGVSETYPALTFYYVFKNLAQEHGILINYKAEQREVGNVAIYVEDISNKRHEDMIRKELRKYFADDVIFELHYAIRLGDHMKKAQYFESMIYQ